MKDSLENAFSKDDSIIHNDFEMLIVTARLQEEGKGNTTGIAARALAVLERNREEILGVSKPVARFPEPSDSTSHETAEPALNYLLPEEFPISLGSFFRHRLGDSLRTGGKEDLALLC